MSCAQFIDARAVDIKAYRCEFFAEFNCKWQTNVSQADNGNGRVLQAYFLITGRGVNRPRLVNNHTGDNVKSKDAIHWYWVCKCAVRRK